MELDTSITESLKKFCGVYFVSGDKFKMSEKPSRERKALTLQERIKETERSSRGKSAIAIAKSLEVGKTQFQMIIHVQRLFLCVFSLQVLFYYHYFYH